MNNWANTKQVLSRLENLLQCSACNKVVNKAQVLGRCEHFFCEVCIEDRKGEACPTCGVPSHVKDVQTNRQLETAATLCKQIAKIIGSDTNTLEDDGPEDSVFTADSGFSIFADDRNENNIPSPEDVTREPELKSSLSATARHAKPSGDSNNGPQNVVLTKRPRKGTKANEKYKKDMVDKSNKEWGIGSAKVERCDSCRKQGLSRKVVFGRHSSSGCEECGSGSGGHSGPTTREGTEETSTEVEEDEEEVVKAPLVSSKQQSTKQNQTAAKAKHLPPKRRQTKQAKTDEKQQGIQSFLTPNNKKAGPSRVLKQNVDTVEKDSSDSDDELKDQPWVSPMDHNEGAGSKNSDREVSSADENSEPSKGARAKKASTKLAPPSQPKSGTSKKGKKTSPGSSATAQKRKTTPPAVKESVGPKSTPSSSRGPQQLGQSPMSTPVSKRLAAVGKEGFGTPTSSQSQQVGKKNSKGETALHVACIKGDVAKVRKLIAEGATVNTKDHAGWTPLHEACNHGNLEITKLLLDAEALINTPGGPDNDTPLHDAVSNYRIECVKLLVSRGASLTQRNLSGKTPMDLAQHDDMKKALNTPVQSTADLNASLTSQLSQTVGRGQLVVVATGLDREQKAKVNKCVTMLHGKMVQEYSSRVSHVVSFINKDGQCPRTLKYLHAVLAGKWIVNIDWVDTCLEYNSWVSEEPFEVPGANTNPNSLAAEKGRLNVERQLPGLFSGCSFYLQGEFSYPNPTRSDITELIKAGEGTMLQREPRLESINQSELIVPYHVTSGSQLEGCSTFVINGKKDSPAEMVGPRLCKAPFSWLLDCIGQFKIISLPGASKN